MTAPTVREAACSCGQLRIRTSGEPRIVSSCHCLECQRRTGSLFGANAFFARYQVVSIVGERRGWQRDADTGASLTFHFCTRCGSTVYWENNRLLDTISIAVGAFADPQFPPPVRTVWTRTKHPWIGFPEGIPHHPENPTKLLPD